MANKQTAVEWLIDQLDEDDKMIYKPDIDQANEMFKKQIIEARETAPERIDQYLNEAEDYYNKTFGKDESK